jgi:hypothetical protein
MGGERHLMMLEVVRARLLDGRRDREVESTALRSDEGAEHGLADMIVGEIEVLPELTKDATTKQLLDGLCRLAVPDRGRAAQQRILEVAAHYRCGGGEASASGAQPIDAVEDQLSHTRGQRKVGS